MIKILLIFILLFTNELSAGILKTVLKSAKSATALKTVKGFSTVELGSYIFNKLDNNDNIRLVINENIDNELEILTSTNKSFVHKVNLNSIDEFFDLTFSEIKDINMEIYIPENLFFKYRIHLEKNEKIKNLTIVREDGTLLKTKLIKDELSLKRIIEIRPNFNIELNLINNIDEIFWLLKQPLNPSDFKVISLFDKSDLSTINTITKNIGELHLPFEKIINNGLNKSFKKLKNKTVFILGHIENGNYVVRGADSSIVQKIPLSQIENISNVYNISLISLGCKGGLIKNSSGFINNVRDIDIISNLDKALTSKNYEELFLSFATIDSPFVIKKSFSDELKLNLDIVKQNYQKEQIVRTTLIISQIRVNTLSQKFVEEIEDRIIWFIPTWIQYTYLILYFLSIGAFWTVWRHLRSIWIIRGFEEKQYFKVILLHSLRFAIYVIFLPLFTLILFIMFPIKIIYKILVFFKDFVIRCKIKIKEEFS